MWVKLNNLCTWLISLQYHQFCLSRVMFIFSDFTTPSLLFVTDFVCFAHLCIVTFGAFHFLLVECLLGMVFIRPFYSLWSIGHPWRASRHRGLQLSPWPRSMIFLCFLSHLLSFATFSSAYLSFCIPEDSSLMQFSLLVLFLCTMCVQFNSIFFFLSDFLLISDGWFSIVLRS